MYLYRPEVHAHYRQVKGAVGVGGRGSCTACSVSLRLSVLSTQLCRGGRALEEHMAGVGERRGGAR